MTKKDTGKPHLKKFARLEQLLTIIFILTTNYSFFNTAIYCKFFVNKYNIAHMLEIHLTNQTGCSLKLKIPLSLCSHWLLWLVCYTTFNKTPPVTFSLHKLQLRSNVNTHQSTYLNPFNVLFQPLLSTFSPNFYLGH